MSATTNLIGVNRKDLRMLVFSSMEEREKSKMLFKEDGELKSFYYLDDPHAPIVQKEAVSLIKIKGLKFRALKPITTDIEKKITKDDLTPKQIELLAQRKAYWFYHPMAIFLVELEKPLPNYMFNT